MIVRALYDPAIKNVRRGRDENRDAAGVILLQPPHPEDVDLGDHQVLARKYLATDGSDIHWVFIRAVLSSVAKLAVIPLQDVLGLGSEARMNTPSKPTGNWRWRYNPCQLTSDLRERLRELTSIYDR